MQLNNIIDSTFSLRIQVGVINPPRVIKSGFIKTFLLHSESGLILETGNSDSVFNTETIPFSLNKLNIAWNLNPSNSSSFPFPMKIVRWDSSSPAYYPYNSFILNFAVQTTTPPNIQLRINVDLITESGATFLTGSISETLPAYSSNKKVSCELVSKIDSTRKIQCSGVGQLVASTTYKLGFKMYT